MIDYFYRAKLDYKTGCYSWFDLRIKYRGLLSIQQIFQAIEEVKKECN